MNSLIEIDNEKNCIHLRAGKSSYILSIIKNQQLSAVHWGASLNTWQGANAPRLVDRSFSPNPDPKDKSFSLDTIRREYPSYGRTDFRTPAIEVRWADGSSTLDLFYVGCKVTNGKPEIKGLPSTFVKNSDDAQTLEIELRDPLKNFKVLLYYTAFRNYSVIARSAFITNEGNEPVSLCRILSLNHDFEGNINRWLQLSGSHINERTPYIRPLVQGTVSIESRRGASSHQQNPFIALLSADADEDKGEVFGINLLYSGNFLTLAEVDQFQMTRVQTGINPFDFSWKLDPGESFYSPEALMAWTDQGLGELSRQFSHFYSDHLCRGKWVKKERPILINNWEATYFNFNEEKLKSIIAQAAPLGIELFVLDDGWFGHRDNDQTSLGDWTVDYRKLPSGLEKLSDMVHEKGMLFGLWFEPEMISQDSKLYKAHPDWCLHVPDRSRSEGRNQLVLDLTRADVKEYILASLCNILDTGKIDYIKWDMNRHMTEVGSAELSSERQRETAHRYILGLYELLESVVGRYPNILFESCSGGGGRYDPGMLFYMPQIWTSDNTDAICRLFIQWGTSIAYPTITMGSHISAVPNHQVQRTTSLNTRANVAMLGAFGYELDPSSLTLEEKNEVVKINTWYKANREVLQFGDFYRLIDPASRISAAWMMVSSDKRKAVLFFYQILAQPNAPQNVIRLKGLNAENQYHVEAENYSGTYAGDELMKSGLRLQDLKGDFQSVAILLYC